MEILLYGYIFKWINWLELFRLWFSFFSCFMGIIGFKKYVWENVFVINMF